MESGRLKPDRNQYACAQRFQGLLEALSTYAPAVEKYEQEARAYRHSRLELRQMMVDRDRERSSAESKGAMRSLQVFAWWCGEPAEYALGYG